jgi:trehalose utilization protein
MNNPIRVTIWNEGRHEKSNEAVRKVYPEGMHQAIAKGIAPLGEFAIRTATLDEPEHGLPEEVLANTDVLTWWGHMAHKDVKDEVAARVQKHVQNGMGLIVLHSGHVSKPFLRLMGTTGALKWREAREKERIWVLEPSHPIAEGLPEQFVLPEEEMYGERFDIPTPDELVMISWFQGGDVFRSGCCWRRGHGRVFYFRPGHETHPTYYDANVLRVIANACRWARRRVTLNVNQCPNAKVPLEPIPPKA